MENQVDQKRIARNTLLLYIRMGLMMLVGFYTARVVLDALGKVDNGLYATVAGVVTMFSFLSNTMATACQRFFGHLLARNDMDELKKTFSMCFYVFVAIALIIVVLCETLGLWLLARKIETEGRMDAAHWIYQTAMLSFMFTILRTPYQGMVIIKEKMKVYTYISVFEVFGNLSIAFIIARFGGDRLILYGILMMCVNMVVSASYMLYCRHFYRECRLCLYWNKERFMEIFGFAGWNMVGQLASICKSQGLTILVNMFFKNSMVSARYMAQKVYFAIQQFSENFVIAIKPQIIKSYAAGDKEGMFKLVFQGSKFSYFLLFFVSLPIFLEAPSILDVWLHDVPEMTVLFARLSIISALVEVLICPLSTSMQTYGKIRNYQLITGAVMLLILPLSWVFLKLGWAVETIYYISVIICAIGVAIRIILVHHYLDMSVRDYLRLVLWPIAVVTLVSVPLPLYLELTMSNPLSRFFVVCSAAVVMVVASVYVLGLTKTERKHLLETVCEKIGIKTVRKS